MSIVDRLWGVKSYDERLNFRHFDEPENFALGDVRIVKALGFGNVLVNMLFQGTKTKKAVLYDVLYAPKLTVI